MARHNADNLSVVALSVAVTAASIFGLASLTGDVDASRIHTWEPGVASPGFPEGYGMYPANPVTVDNAQYGRWLGSRYQDTGGVLQRHGARQRPWTDLGLYHEAAPLYGELGGRVHRWEPGVRNPYDEGAVYGEGVILPPVNPVENAERGRRMSWGYRGSDESPLLRHGTRARHTLPPEGVSSSNLRYNQADVDFYMERGLGN